MPPNNGGIMVITFEYRATDTNGAIGVERVSGELDSVRLSTKISQSDAIFERLLFVCGNAEYDISKMWNIKIWWVADGSKVASNIARGDNVSRYLIDGNTCNNLGELYDAISGMISRSYASGI